MIGGGGFFGPSGLRSGSNVEGLVFRSAVLGLRSEVFWWSVPHRVASAGRGEASLDVVSARVFAHAAIAFANRVASAGRPDAIWAAFWATFWPAFSGTPPLLSPIAWRPRVGLVRFGPPFGPRFGPRGEAHAGVAMPDSASRMCLAASFLAPPAARGPALEGTLN